MHRKIDRAILIYMAALVRHRRSIILVVCVLVAVLVIGQVAQHPVRGSFITQAELERIARLAVERQESLADQSEQVLKLLSKLPTVRGEDAAGCNSTLADMLSGQSRFINFGVLDTEGKLWCSAVPFSGTVDASSRSYFKRVMASQRFSVGDYQIGAVTGKPSLNFAYPVRDTSANITGVVFVAVDLAWLRDFSEVVELPPDAQLIVTDNHGVVLQRYPDNSQGIIAPEINLELVKIVDIQTGLGVIELKNASNESFYVVAAPVKLAAQEGFVHVFVSAPKRSIDLATMSVQVSHWLAALPLVP